MKKNRKNYSKMVAAIIIVPAVVCSIAWITPTFFRTEKKMTGSGATAPATTPPKMTEENQLIVQLEKDGLINQVKGFVVEKKKSILWVNGKQLRANVAGKYLSALQKENMRVEVYPFMDRLKQHPDAGFIQILLPVLMSSPCVDTKPQKPGC